MPARKWWGWGYEDDGVDGATFDGTLRALSRLLGEPELTSIEVADPASIQLRPPRFQLPTALADISTDAPLARLSHSYGKAYTDLMRAVRGDVPNPVDFICSPRDERQITALMRFCEAESIAITPYGGGSSVVGGVEPTTDSRFRGTVSLDMVKLAALIEVDERSRLGHFAAGMLGPAVEASVRPQALTLRHFPQSFEFSSVGGWIVTRAAGHYATGPTHIDDLVAGIRMVTPRGVIVTSPSGYSGSGPAPERLVLGSEGVLGVVTSAWLRLHAQPVHRASSTVCFEDPAAGVEAVRAIAMSDLQPANCRLISPLESALTGLGDGKTADLLLGFESADHAVDPLLDRALEMCAALRGSTSPASEGSALQARGGSDRWRTWFFQAPYLRDRLALRGLIVETLETSCSWSNFVNLHETVLKAIAAAVETATGRRGIVTWRLTHVYPDGVAPYYTVIGVGTSGREIDQWMEIKRAASDAIEGAGGASTHHHAVGRTHLPYFERERGELYVEALSSAKKALDPTGIMNPGVLLPAAGAN